MKLKQRLVIVSPKLRTVAWDVDFKLMSLFLR